MKSNVLCTISRSLLCLLTTLVLAQVSPAQQNKISIAPSDPVTVKRGETAKQVLRAVILPGFHVNSDKPRDEFLIPLKLTWNAGPLEAKSISYPKPEEMDLNGQKMVVYTGTIPIETEFLTAKDAAKGATTVTGKLRYQACNNQMCFRPSTLDVHFAVVIE
jgi:DsbC/DsbD-like thiol-disulfide interchange protein